MFVLLTFQPFSLTSPSVLTFAALFWLLPGERSHQLAPDSAGSLQSFYAFLPAMRRVSDFIHAPIIFWTSEVKRLICSNCFMVMHSWL